ncbi:alkaline phosphatase PafA [Aurantibacillus circumpalustris]|uniref:alkaline phosphatase PafA n=1 Tax=Aurantibacillus circumpalustris TaxID=3036359 RepID=UPI00295B3252|nr:alkaline phosphatase PafA [Aurantibacillus circumpalustris]
MKKSLHYFSIIFILLNYFPTHSQNNKTENKKPKLVIGIVVDQMRNDYLYRYWKRYGNGGFKRLVNQGYYFKNAHYNYVPTYTGPGHCSIYTGATPKTHGIIGNDWFVKANGTITYCVSDSNQKSVGTESKNGKMSPKNQLSSTIGDELKMSSNQNAKVFAISLKDRSAVLPAGHAANGAFWFDDVTGNFISSTWYMKELPEWVKTFNDKKLCKNYLEKGWSTLYPIDSYTSSLPDNNRYEETLGKEKPIFPYEFKTQIEKAKWGIIKTIPAGNSLTKDLALTCILSESLGKGSETDLLSISFSSTDYIGHAFGTRAIETEDVYLRLDKDIEEILITLDKELGEGNYTVFLTADHGGADVPNHLLDYKILAGYINEKQIVKAVKKYFKTNYSDTLLFANMSNEQVFLNEQKITELKLNKNDLETDLASFLITLPGIAEAYTSISLKNTSYPANDFKTLLQNGYNHKLSGNVAIIYQPAWMDHAEKGTTHGAAYNYDTHVPVIFYGMGIPKGDSYKYISITQIAPTVCELLKINQPNGSTAEPLNDYFK